MSWIDAIFKMTPLARFYTSPTQVENGSLSELQCNDRGELLVSLDGAKTQWQDSQNAPSASRAVKTAPGYLHQIEFTNTHGANTYYVFLFNTETLPADGGPSLFIPIKLPPGETRGFSLVRPRYFSAGIYWVASSTKTVLTLSSAAPILSTAEYS